MGKIEKRKWCQAARGSVFLAAALAGGFLWGSPVWAGSSGDTRQENQVVMEGRMATPCNAEKKKCMEPGGGQDEGLYVSAIEIILPEPYRKGYTFMEWNTEPDGSGEFYVAGEFVRITEMTLYAVWEKDEAEDVISVETATSSNAKRATSSNRERMKTEEMKKASGQDQNTEPEEKTNTKMDRITEVKRSTESNAERMEIWKEPGTEQEAMEEDRKIKNDRNPYEF